MHCDRFQALIGAYVAEDMDEVERRDFREHLRQCRSCREIAVSEEPSLLFATMKTREAAADEVDTCVSAVAALIHQDRLQRQLRPRVSRWLMAAAAVALVVVGGGILWQTAQIGNPVAPDAVVEAAADSTESEVVPPRIEVDMSGEGVRVYQFAQEEDENTAVSFVVNSAMEL